MTQPPPSPALFFDTLNAYQRSEALATAIEVKLFTAIADGSDTAAKIAQRCQIAERGARILADYLGALGFLTKQDGRYALTPDSAAFLNEHSPAYVGAASQFLRAPQQLANFRALTQRVKNGGAPTDHTVLESGPEADEMWVKFARGMTGLMTMPARLLAQRVTNPSSPVKKILDVASSHGAFGIAVAQANLGAKLVALDFPAVLEVTKEGAAKAGLLDRFETIPGDVFKVSLGDNYDLILLPNILHHFDVPTCETLLKKVLAALAPKGRVAIVEFIPNPDRISPPTPAMFSLVMLANTPSGDAYTATEFQQMLTRAGFSGSTFEDLMPGMQQVGIATK
jgi:2-polyprenyl-3-methyl-5-hydroxy-6-metoxy-1,4-benzoquinol methylase